ncbi:MAG TPA: AmmeMemoRadiSam system protein B [Gammaproteobacteria bacterium]|nr:AmmeMemoRadiSam system protein B [Gammaproteobacteria bacterium]
MVTRPPAVANQFYPGDPAVLRRQVEDLLAEAARGPSASAAPKAIIAPHAGYIYSGPVAASVYQSLRPVRQQIRRVVLLGPAHRVYLRGLAVPTVEGFHTPLGDITLDQEAIAAIRALPQVVVSDEAHAEEHSLEVHLPFLQNLLENFTLVPLVVGDASPAQVAEVLAKLWGGPETLIVISTDLSHYHPYQEAREIDQRTSAAILNLQYEMIGPEQACGCRPLNGLLHYARSHHLHVTNVDLRNSGDTAGPRNRVVGYGAYLVDENASFTNKERHTLPRIARDSLKYGLYQGRALAVNLADCGPALRATRASFVTLTKNGQLRGCIGTLEAHRPLAVDVAANAYASGFRDPRFPALNAVELAQVHIHISVLSPPAPMTIASEEDLRRQLRPGEDGLILELGHRRATFLPSVWEDLTTPEIFVEHLKHKAGIGRHEDTRGLKVWRYTTESIHEEPASLH